MKNSNYIINGVLAAAIIILFILQFTGKNADSKPPRVSGISPDSSIQGLPLAYIRTDSLFATYKFAIDLNETILKKYDDEKAIIDRRTDAFRREVAKFNDNVQNNAYYSQDKLKGEQIRLSNMEKDLEKYISQAESRFAMERADIGKQLQDTIKAALAEYNTPKKYEIIFSNVDTDNILYADDKYDITGEIIEYLNARYVPGRK